MGLFGTLREAFEASTQTATNGPDDGSEGAYWCTDCGERVRDVDVAGDGPPNCPSCDEPMEFERSPGATGCAC
jgi:rubrerythrin